jgi:D-glycerate 3-kinase
VAVEDGGGEAGGSQQRQGAGLHVPELAPINSALLEFEQLYALFDALIVMQVADPSVVYRWREEAEARARFAGRGAMSKEEVERFVDCYMPAYREYLGDLYDPPPDSLSGPAEPFAGKPQLRFFIDDNRLPCADASQAAGCRLPPV